jgi:hypothetical protein
MAKLIRRKRPQRSASSFLFDKPFTGHLSALGVDIAMRFRMRILANGEVDLRFRRRRMTKALWTIYRAWSSERGSGIALSLRGVATDGTRFESDDLHISNFGQVLRGDDRPHTMKPVAECLRGYLRAKPNTPRSLPVLQWRLTGFECFPALYATCELGKLQMAGETRMTQPGPVNGLLTLEATELPDDLEAWRGKADALFEHIRRIMSFAASTMLGAPVAEFWHGAQWEAEILSHTAQRSPSMRVFHSLDLQPIFGAALESHFRPPRQVKNLPYAIEWFSMSSSYDEVRLIAAMTALENLIDSNLERRDSVILPQKAFDRLRRGLRASMSDLLADAFSSATDGLIPTLNEKLIELNRKPLREKLMKLVQAWTVSLTGISDADIRAAIAARNLVVHRGHHDRQPDDPDLWRHVTVVREIVVRLILAAIGYHGRYISHLGGYHFSHYPPEDAPGAESAGGKRQADG